MLPLQTPFDCSLRTPLKCPVVLFVPSELPPLMLQKMREVCELSSETYSNLNHCLSLFSRQDGVRHFTSVSTNFVALPIDFVFTTDKRSKSLDYRGYTLRRKIQKYFANTQPYKNAKCPISQCYESRICGYKHLICAERIKLSSSI